MTVHEENELILRMNYGYFTSQYMYVQFESCSSIDKTTSLLLFAFYRLDYHPAFKKYEATFK